MFLRRLVTPACCLLLAVSMFSLKATGQSLEKTTQQPEQLSLDLGNRSNQPKYDTQAIFSLADGSVIQGAGTFLVRNKDNVFVSAHSQKLPAGWVVTAWIVVFNYPINCATSPCTANDLANPAVEGSVHNVGGQIVGADGAANYSAFLAVGDKLGVTTEPGGVGLGVLNPFGAQINVVLRGHGQASSDPAVLGQQTSMLNGSCPAGGCVDLQRARHLP